MYQTVQRIRIRTTDITIPYKCGMIVLQVLGWKQIETGKHWF